MFLTIWIIVSVLAIAVFLYVNRRIDKVYEYRIALIDRIGAQNIEEIKSGSTCEDTLWRWDEFGEVGFGKMVWSVKDFDSFFPRDPARSEK